MIHAIACSILQSEMEAVLARLRQEGEVVDVDYLDSALHMKPRKLEAVLAETLKEEDMIFFGDCCAGMTDFERAGHIRVAVPNCMEWLLGKARYRELVMAGAFFVQREWAERWQIIFQQELGLADMEVAHAFFSDMHRMLVYLDTGVAPVPSERLREMSEFTGLPATIEPVTLDPMEQVLREALKKRRTRDDGNTR